MASKGTIVVVEDERIVAFDLKNRLEALGYQVDDAADGQLAYDLFLMRHHHVVISDLQMPRIEGLTLLKRLRAVDPDVQVIILTGFTSVSAPRSCS